MQAIPTRYQGYHFRSRLEARWAVVFTALNLKWLYEPEGFILPSGDYYLPDFRVGGELPFWVEVKREGEGSRLFEQFVKTLPDLDGAAIFHEIPHPDSIDPHKFEMFFRFDGNIYKGFFSFRWYNGQAWLEPARDDTYPDERIAAAFEAGRSARFEHKARVF